MYILSKAEHKVLKLCCVYYTLKILYNNLHLIKLQEKKGI